MLLALVYGVPLAGVPRMRSAMMRLLQQSGVYFSEFIFFVVTCLRERNEEMCHGSKKGCLPFLGSLSRHFKLGCQEEDDDFRSPSDWIREITMY